MVVFVLVGVSVGLIASSELRVTRRLREFEADYAAAGGHVTIVRSETGTLPVSRCEALNERPGVVAAGAVSADGTGTPLSAPGQLVAVMEVSPGAVAVLSPGSEIKPPTVGGMAVVGEALADELGLGTGSFSGIQPGPPVTVAGVIRGTPRSPTALRWFAEVVDEGESAEECWVEFERRSAAAGSAALGAWFADGDELPEIRPFTRRTAFTRDTAAEFRDRVERFGWLAAGGLIAAVFLLVGWFRRAEFALYLAVGTRRLELAGMLAVEAAVLVGLGATAGILWAFAIDAALAHPWHLDESLVAVRTAGSGALLGWLLAPLAASVAARGNVAAMLKER